jgi:cobalt-zinc-cadmium efflux system protein
MSGLHLHTHSDTEGHSHPQNPKWGSRLVAVMVMNLIVPAIQVYGGIISGSMALISDALHNLSDFTAVLISYVALRMGRRGPSMSQTFGYRRAEILAALLNVGLLYGIAMYMAIEAGKRLSAPQAIDGETVIWVALAAVVGNILSTVLLRGGAKDNVNMRSAFLHMLVDSLVSMGVLVMGVIWLYRPWYWLDPLISWGIVVLVLFSGWDIIKESVRVLMNAAPPSIDLKAIQREVESVDGVMEVHHLHVWTLDSKSVALTAHILVPDQMLGQVDTMADRIRTLLAERFHIDHPVLQFETRPYEETALLCCRP